MLRVRRDELSVTGQNAGINCWRPPADRKPLHHPFSFSQRQVGMIRTFVETLA